MGHRSERKGSIPDRGCAHCQSAVLGGTPSSNEVIASFDFSTPFAIALTETSDTLFVTQRRSEPVAEAPPGSMSSTLFALHCALTL